MSSEYPAQYDSSRVGDGGQQDYPGGIGPESGTNNDQYASGRDEGHHHHHHHHTTDDEGGNQRNTSAKDDGYNTTGLGTDNRDQGRTDEGHQLGGNQRNTNANDDCGNQRNPNVKDRVVGKVERAFGGNATTGNGADNQYQPTNGRSGEEYPPGGNQSQGVTGAGVKPSVTDKIVGGVEKVAGKVTGNTNLYQEGKARIAGETGKTGDY
jgi:hypothetical protein